MRSLSVVLLALTGAVAAAQPPGFPKFPEDEVLVIVWSGQDRCSVLERTTNCSRVASVMTGVLQVGRDRDVVVATDGRDDEVMIRLARVMTDIRAAGFRRVRQADPPR